MKKGLPWVRLFGEGEPHKTGTRSMQTNAYSINEFCQSHGISRSMFYVLLERGQAPKTMKIGRRRLISAAEAARWCMSMTERNSQ